MIIRNSDNVSIFNIKNENYIEVILPEEPKKHFGYVNNIKRNYDFKFTGIIDQNKSQHGVFQTIGEKIIKK